jgi:DNA-binding transcriptional ArsR family regulator
MSGASGLDEIFGCLTDPTRRDILRRVATYQLTVGQLAERYNIGFAAVSKHLKVLEKAGLIIKNRVGRKHYIALAPAGFKDAAEYLDFYKNFWESNLDSLANYLEKEA